MANVIQRLSNFMLGKPKQGGTASYAIIAPQVRSFASALQSTLRYQTSFSPDTLSRMYSASVAAYACINKQAQYVASVPIKVVDYRGNDVEQSPATLFLLRKYQMLFAFQCNLLIYGSFYAHKEYNRFGFPSDIRYVNSLDVREAYNKSGYLIDDGKVFVPLKDMICNYTFNPRSNKNGVSALEVAMVKVQLGADMARWAVNYFANNAIPPLLISIKDGTEDDADILKQKLQQQHKGVENAHRAHVTSMDVELNQLNSSPADLALVELDKIVVRDVCVTMDINPVLVGFGQAADALSAQSTRKSIEIEHIENYTLPWVQHQILDPITVQWLARDFPLGEYQLVVDEAKLALLLRATPERSTMVSQNVQGSILGVNEGRELLGLPPRQGNIEYNPAWGIAMWGSNGITLNEFRASVGLPPVDGGDTIFQKDWVPALPAPSLTFSLPPNNPNPPVHLHMPPNSPSMPPLLSAPPSPDKKALLKELTSWQRRVKAAKSPTVEYDDFELPEEITDWVSRNLAEWWNPILVFRQARAWIRDEKEPEPLGAAPEEAEEYWQHFDSIAGDLGAVWIDYMRRQSDELIKRITVAPSENMSIASVLGEGHATLNAELIGTRESPGLLTKLILGGMAAGNDSLNAELTRSKRAVTVEIDWTLLEQDAFEFAENYAGVLITELDNTTEEQIRAAIAEWIKSGKPLEDLIVSIESLLPIGDNTPERIRQRAEAIAQTEATIAYNEGAMRRWERSGVTDASWQTVRDSHVCFPKGIKVQTENGEMAIEAVKPNMKVWTRKGLKRVIATQERMYNGRYCFIKTDNGNITCTDNHPFYVQGNWVAAGNLSVGDLLYLDSNEFTKISRIVNFDLTNPDNLDTLLMQEIIASLVSSTDRAMPVFPVNFQGNIVISQEEINTISSNLMLLDECNGNGSECFSDGGFGQSFPFEPTITHERAELPILLGTLSSKHFAAISASHKMRGAAAKFGTMLSRKSLVAFESLTTSDTVEIRSVNGSTSHRAIAIPMGNAFLNREFLATSDTSFGNVDNFVSRVIAFVRTKFTTTLGKNAFPDLKSIAAMLTSALGIAGQSIASSRAKYAFALPQSIGLNFYSDTALNTFSCDHNNSLFENEWSQLYHRLCSMLRTVYNLEVEGESEYFANGILVHNCNICRPLHGVVSNIRQGWTSPYNGKTYKLSAHPRCRCFRRPVVEKIDDDELAKLIGLAA